MDATGATGGERRRDPWRRGLRALVAAVLVLSALALGGAHPIVNAALALVLTGALVAFVVHEGGELELPWVGVALGLALALTGLQLVPLPLTAIAALSPRAAESLRVSLGESLAWAPLSLDPPATAHELAKLAAYLAAAVLAAAVFRRRRTLLLTIVAAAGGSVLALGLAQALVGVDRPYGAFGYPLPGLASSFVNPNHLAGYLGGASLVALGLAVEARGARRVVLAGLAALTGAGVLLSLSRGGLVGYLAGLAVFVFLGRSTKGRGGGVATYLALAGALLVAGFLGYGRMVHELWTLGDPQALSKLEIWRPVPALLRDFGWTGAGRGALAAVYPQYAPEGLTATFTHLENEPLQALVDWGLLGGAAVLVAFALVFLRVVGMSRRPAGAGAASALVLLAAQNLGDFGLELSAVALAAVCLLAVVGPAPGELVARGRLARLLARRLVVPPRLARAGAVALLVLAAIAGGVAVEYDLPRDGARLRARLASARPEERARALAAVARRHPGDYLLPLLVAERELADGNPRGALAWINRGLFLAPGFAGGHRLAGRALLRLGARDQALLEYRLASRAAPLQAPEVAAEVLERTRDPRAVAALAGDDVGSRVAVARFLSQRRAHDVVLEVLAGAPEDPLVLRLRAQAELGASRPAAALELALRLMALAPEDPSGVVLAAEAHRASGAPGEALAVLERGVARFGPIPALAHARALLLLGQGDFEGARQAARLLLASAGDDDAQAQAHSLLGVVSLREGRKAAALHHFVRARDADPRSLGYRLSIAAVRAELGDARGARDELERARLEVGSTPELEAALARVMTPER